MPTSFTISEILPARPAKIYQAWLTSDGHTNMTGSPASVDGTVGGQFSAWEGYITGTTLELAPNQRIVQAWRTPEFCEEAPDSHLEVLLQEEQGGMRVTLIHSNLPEGQTESYRRGWEEFYFKSMREYFPGDRS